MTNNFSKLKVTNIIIYIACICILYLLATKLASASTYNGIDLKVDNIQTYPYLPKNGESINVNFGVKNNSDRVSSGYSYQIILDNHLISNAQVNTTIYPNQIHTTKRSVLIPRDTNPNQNSRLNLYIIISPNEYDNNISNNHLNKVIEKSFLDLKAVSLSYQKIIINNNSNKNHINAGDKIKVDFKVRNLGTSSINATNFPYKIFLGDKSYNYNSDNINLAPGANYIFTKELEIPTDTNHNIYIRAEVNSNKDEYKSNDTTINHTINIYPENINKSEDLNIINANYNINNNNSSININYEVENIGEKASYGFKWHVYLDNQLIKSDNITYTINPNYKRIITINNIPLNTQQLSYKQLKLKLAAKSEEDNTDNNEYIFTPEDFNITETLNSVSNNFGHNNNQPSNNSQSSLTNLIINSLNQDNTDSDYSIDNTNYNITNYSPHLDQEGVNIRFGDLYDCKISGNASISNVPSNSATLLGITKLHKKYCYQNQKNTDFHWNINNNYVASIDSFGTLRTKTYSSGNFIVTATHKTTNEKLTLKGKVGPLPTYLDPLQQTLKDHLTIKEAQTDNFIKTTEQMHFPHAKQILYDKINVAKVINELQIVLGNVKSIIGLPKINEMKIDRLFSSIYDYNFYGNTNEKLIRDLIVFGNEIKKKNFNQAINNLENKLEHYKVQSNLEKYKDKVIPFKDSGDDKWFSSHIMYLSNKRLISGYRTKDGIATGYFKPENFISIAEALKIIVNIQNGRVNTDYDQKDRKPIVVKAANHWSRDIFIIAEDMGISLAKIPNLDPSTYIKRKDMVKAILESEGYEYIPNDIEYFYDVPSRHPYKSWINLATDLEIVKKASHFRPDDLLNRAEAAKLLHLADTIL